MGANRWTQASSIRVGSDRVVNMTERHLWMREFSFDTSEGGAVHGPWEMMETCIVDHHEQLIVTSVEGRLDTAAADDHAARRLLGDATLIIRRSCRRVLEMGIDLITPQDSVLEARVASLESMLAHLVGIDDEASERQRKLRDALQRLGWTPPSVVDHRKLSIPICFDRTERYDVSLTSPVPIKWTCILSGTVTRDSQ